MTFGRTRGMALGPFSTRSEQQLEYDRGAALLRDDDVLAALPLLERAAARCGNDSETMLYLTWARARAWDARASARARTAATHHARRALEEGRAAGLALCVLGHAAFDRGDLHAARELFRRAAAADRSLVDARRQLLFVSRRIEAGERASVAWNRQVANLVTRFVASFRA
jgi:tetratricopeptide (TPR) repeat protein